MKRVGLFVLLLVAACQPERTPEAALDHILALEQYVVWLDNPSVGWSVRVEPEGDRRVVSLWRDREPHPTMPSVPYSAEHEALIRQIVSEAGVDTLASDWNGIRYGVEGGGEKIIFDDMLMSKAERLDSLGLRLVNLGR